MIRVSFDELYFNIDAPSTAPALRPHLAAAGALGVLLARGAGAEGLEEPATRPVAGRDPRGPSGSPASWRRARARIRPSAALRAARHPPSAVPRAAAGLHVSIWEPMPPCSAEQARALYGAALRRLEGVPPQGPADRSGYFRRSTARAISR